MQDKTFAVEGLRRQRPSGSEIKLGINIILDERHLTLREHGDELALVIVGHAAAKRVLKRRHDDTGFYAMPFKRRAKGSEIDALSWMGRYFDRFKPHAFDSHQR